MKSDICRTCLTSVLVDSCKSLSSPADDLQPLNTIGDVLKDLIREINLDITVGPVICCTCYKELLVSIKFKYKCIKSEEIIKSCITNSESGQCVLSDIPICGNNKTSQEEEVIVIEVEKNCEEESPDGTNVSSRTHEVIVEEANTSHRQDEREQLPSDKSQKPFECTACDTTFTNYQSLESHAFNDHEVEQLYKCKVCQNMFTNAQRAQEHALQHIGSGKYSCEDMIRILPFYINGRPKTCKKCLKGYLWCCQFKEKPSELCCKCLGHKGTFSVLFEKVSNQDNSANQEIEINKLQCSYCSKSFLFEDDLEKHLHSHVTKRYSCGECGAKFSRKSSVADHMEIVHKGVDAFKCNKCWRRYTKRESFNKHLRSHEGEVFNICEICGKNSMSKGDLAKHIRRHLGEKRHQCPICGKLFVVRYSMLEHERTHDKDYAANNRCVCEVCGKVLATPGSLALHKAKYCSIGRYKCELCDRTFRYKRHQKSHMQDHKEHPKHKCHICELNYPSWLALRKHQRAQHRLSSRTIELQPTQPTVTSGMQL